MRRTICPRPSFTVPWLCLSAAGLAGCRSIAHGPEGAAHALPAPAPLVVPRRSIDVEHYALELALDPVARTLEGRARVRYWPVPGAAAMEYVELDLVGLDVRSVTDANRRKLVFRHDGSLLGVTLAEPLEGGQPGELVIEYGGTPVCGLWFADEEHGAATQVFTQGECQDARGWFPCVDDPSDRATFEIAVTMPASWTAVCAGVRSERVEQGELVRERWRADFPHPPYLATLVAGEFVTRTGSFDGVPLLFLADARHAAHVDATFEETDEVLALFSRLTGVRYPYPKYAQACVAEFCFGGMENISATTLTDTTLTDERGRRDGDAHGLIAHEAAHQWFGDLLTCADWSHVWLNEGFATYFGALYTEARDGEGPFRLAMRGAQDANAAGDSGARRRPVVFDVCRQPMDLFFTGHVYQGGAARLHLLRGLLGDADFFRGIELYVGRNQGRSVVTDDLRVALEAASGMDLRAFFDQWLYGPGHPELRVRWRWDEGRGSAVLTVEQTQAPTDGVPAVFRAPVEVEIAHGGERRTERIELTERAQEFVFRCSERPTWLCFDSGGWLPKTCVDEKTGHEWLALLRGSSYPDVRIEALRALVKVAAEGSERAELVEAVLDRARNDPLSEVRRTAVETVTKLDAVRTRSALRDIAVSDETASVRCAALAALVPKAPDADLARFAEAVFEAGFSWNTMGNAAALLAAARPEGAFEWLQRQRGIGTPHGVLEAALVAAIGRSDARAARAELLRTALDGAEHDHVRAAAATALGRHAKGDRALTRELIALLGARGHRLRRAVIRTLGADFTPTVRSALIEHWERTPFATERHAIQSLLDGAKAAG